MNLFSYLCQKRQWKLNDIIKTRIEAVLPILNERQRRIYLSAEA